MRGTFFFLRRRPPRPGRADFLAGFARLTLVGMSAGQSADFAINSRVAEKSQLVG